jgi:hypothetical protein
MNWQKLPVFIDDLLTTLTTVWSSQMVHNEIEAAKEAAAADAQARIDEALAGGGGSGGGPSNVVRFYDTMAELKADKKLTPGMLVKTRGYYEVDDDGGAQYVIADKSELVWAEKLESGKVALINEKTRVTYRMFGAHLDGKQDDGPMMVNCHKYADSQFVFDQKELIRIYTCTVENHQGIIYKQGVKAINCNSDIDLSGSCLLIDDTNATWFGVYVWGDVDSLYYDWEIPDDVKERFSADTFSFNMQTNKGDALPANTVLKLEEDPYTARDDSGYLYTVARRELIVHDMNGICSSPLTDDWRHAGGEEINCQISNLEEGTTETVQSFTTFRASYTYVTSKHGTFTGCDVLLNMSSNKYCSVMWCKRHNATVQNFIFRPRSDALHNTAFKNTMIYIWDSYNVRVKNLQGFNASGQADGSSNGTSGYMLRVTNCSDVVIEDCRMQGYWGATAMDSVKNIHVYRCHLNRFDIHDYFSNLWIEDCKFYDSSIQIGYGRGMCSVTNCLFYWNPITNSSYPSAHIIEFNLSYGRLFEGLVYVDNCRVVAKNPPDNEFNIFKMEFSPNATSITKHFLFPTIICKNMDIQSDKADTHYAYFKITGTRRATTSTTGPTHVYGISNDGSVVWQYYGRGVNWGEDVTSIEKDGILRVTDTFLDTEDKTQFYNRRYYRCTQAGTLNFGGAKPDNRDGAVFTCGTAKLVYFPEAMWKSKGNYAVGDICGASPSNWYPLYLFRCIGAGTSNGYFPTHLTGTVLEGKDDSVSEPDNCWWTYVAKRSEWCIDWQANMTVVAGKRLLAENRLYEIVNGGQLTEYPPYDTYWFGEHDWGTARLKFIGSVHTPKAWYAKGSYCEARGNIYQLAKHDGTTTGVLPTRGNPNCVDGDIIWEYKSGDTPPPNPGTDPGPDPSEAVPWQANTEYADGTVIQAGTRLYVVQQATTGTSNPTDTSGNIIMDGERRIKFLKRTKEQWRQPSTAYSVGYICWDYVSGTSQINVFAECITAGTTAATGWGPTASANWSSEGTFQDGTVVWKKISDKGIWRNSGMKYPSGTIYLTDVGEPEGEGYVRLYMSLGGVSGSTAPTDTSGTVFKNGSLILAYTQAASASASVVALRATGDTWKANTMYNVGDQVISNGNTYECVFDGKMVMPNKTVFENITTNMSNGHVFWFFRGTDVPTKQGTLPWELIVNNCEGVDPLTAEGLSGDTRYFCHSSNPNPVIRVGGSGGQGSQGPQGPAGVGVQNAKVDSSGDLIVTLTNSTSINSGHVVGAAGAAGAAGMVWQGAWSSSTAYAVRDAVSFDGSTYLALAAHTGVTPGTNPATWGLVARKGADGSGGQGAQGPAGVGVQSAQVDSQGDLIVTLTNSDTINSGHVVGAAGATGAAGSSAYQIWLAAGNTGTEAAFLAGLKGQPGEAGAAGMVWQGVWSSGATYAVRDAVSFNGSTYLALVAHSGVTPGTNPATWGLVAQKGADGGGAGNMTKVIYDHDEDGKVDAAEAADVALAVSYIDMTVSPAAGNTLLYDETAGKFKPGVVPGGGGQGSQGPEGPQGPAGVGVQDAKVDSQGDLIVTLTNNNIINSGHVVGAAGATGAAGSSAYQIWLAAGNTGTEAAFLAGLKGQAGDAGAPGMVWRGVWSSGTAYAVRDTVSHDGSTYLAMADHTGVTPGMNPATWGLVAQKGADGGSGAGNMTKAVYDHDDDGKVDAAAAADVAHTVSYIDMTVVPSEGNTLLYDGTAGKFKPGVVTGGGVDMATVISLLPGYYQRDVLWQQGSGRAKLLPPARLAVNIKDKGYLLTDGAELDLAAAASWDSTATDYRTATNRAGKDFYIYACRPVSGTVPVFLISANNSAPVGYTSANSRKVGGFHCLCLAAGTISGHPLSGYATGDILPASIWDLQHRPYSSPEGMVYSEQANLWIDIYLQSGTGSATASVFGAKITDALPWMDVVDNLAAVKKRLLRDDEFQIVAEGSNQQTNIQGNNDPVNTGGHLDSSSRRMISNIGCEDCCGVMWQWLLDQAYRFNSAGSHTHSVTVTGDAQTVATGTAVGDLTPASSNIWLAGNKGRLYAQGDKCDAKLCAGGKWSSSSNSGSRARYLTYDRTMNTEDVGARGCSAHKGVGL